MSYKDQVLAFAQDYFSIRREFGLPSNLNHQIQYFTFKNYLGDNCNIQHRLQEVMNSRDEKVLFVAPTGAGKTFSFAQLNGYIALLTPYRKQSLQNAKKYHMKSIVGSDGLTLNEFIENKRITLTYDKSKVLQEVIDAFSNDQRTKDERITIIVDECHMLTSAQYRKESLARVREMIKTAEKYGHNIIYTTATFHNCHMLDLKNIILCDNGRLSNIHEIREYMCAGNCNSADFILHSVVRELEQGRKVLLRINNKKLIDNIEEYVRNHGYRVAVLTSEIKEDNVVFDGIINDGVLCRDYDLYLLTCIIDAGVTIDAMSDGSTPADIVPMYFLDRYANLDELKQFSNRIRWRIGSMVLLVDKHKKIELNYDEKTDEEYYNPGEEFLDISTIVNKKASFYRDYCNNFNAIANGLETIYKDKRMVCDELQHILCQKDFYGRKNDLGGAFSLDINAIYSKGNAPGNTSYVCFDRFFVFNNLYNQYMRQFFIHDDYRRSHLRDVFGCQVLSCTIFESNIKHKYHDYTKEHFDAFLDELQDDYETQRRFREKDYRGLEHVVRDPRFEILEKLTTYTKDLDMAIKEIRSLPDGKTINKGVVLGEYERQDIVDLSPEDCRILEKHLVTKKEKQLSTNVLRVMDGSYASLLEAGANLGLDMRTMQRIIEKGGLYDIKKYVREEQIIQNNKKHLASKLLAGRAGMQQAALITIIEKKRGDKQGTITLCEKDLNPIAQEMSSKTDRKWTARSICDFIQGVYVCSISQKKKKKPKRITVRGLRMNHTGGAK